MATVRPTVSIYQYDNPKEKTGTVALPHVMMSPLRPDIVREVHKLVNKNRRNPYAVSSKAGYETAAESWGTGRAVARIPRAPGGGTHRAGQGAFGNMCRGGGMFCPTKTWRRWPRKVNVREKRHAVATALAASCLPPLVMARGHRIGQVNELPLVVSDGLESVSRTKVAVGVLHGLGLKEELVKIIKSKKLRAGKGKSRNRRYVKRTGPLVIYKEDNGVMRGMRNIPGVDTENVTRMNILKLAPGGNFGRFIIWTESAFKFLYKIYGTWKTGAPMKKNYVLPRAVMENADVARIINSTEIQSVLRPKLEPPQKFEPKKNPLKNKKEMLKLNPFVRPAVDKDEMAAKRKARIQASKEYNKKYKKGDDTWWKRQMKAFEPKPVEQDAEENDE